MNSTLPSINLTHNLIVNEIEVLAEISLDINSNRPAILSILMQANTNGGSINASMLSSTLLQRSEKTCERLLGRLALMGFFDEEWDGKRRHWILNEKGNAAVSQKKIFRLEYGVFRVQYTEDPLYTNRVLSIEPVAIKGTKWGKKAFESQKENQEETVNLPECLQETMGKPIYIQYGSSRREKKTIQAVIDKIENITLKNKEQKNKSHYKINIEITLEDEISMHLPKFPDIDLPLLSSSDLDNFTWEDIILYGLGRSSKEWDSNEKLWRVSFAEIKNEGKSLRDFKRDVPTKDFSHPVYGKFTFLNPLSLPIQPKSKKDAEEWALKLLIEDKIKKYFFSETELEQSWQTVTNEFLDSFRLDEMYITRDNLANKIKTKLSQKDQLFPSEYWYLKAPLDLMEEKTNVQL